MTADPADPDPYATLAHLVHEAHSAVELLVDATDDSEALASYKGRDALRAAAEGLTEAGERLSSLLDWADSSELPPGLRAALAKPGWSELEFDPANPGSPRRGSTPEQAGESLPALAHTDTMDAEVFDFATLDIATLPPAIPSRPQIVPNGVPGPDPRHARLRLRAHAAEFDAQSGPHELASLYLDAAGARRLAGLLRQSAVALEGEQ